MNISTLKKGKVLSIWLKISQNLEKDMFVAKKNPENYNLPLHLYFYTLEVKFFVSYLVLIVSK